jgi:hypothetical protein
VRAIACGIGLQGMGEECAAEYDASLLWTLWANSLRRLLFGLPGRELPKRVRDRSANGRLCAARRHRRRCGMGRRPRGPADEKSGSAEFSQAYRSTGFAQKADAETRKRLSILFGRRPASN